MTDVLFATTSQLAHEDLTQIRDLMTTAFLDDFSEEDWEHTLGGHHFFIRQDRLMVSHAAVVSRDIQAGIRMFRCGYVEGVATHPAQQRRGLGTLVMQEAAAHIRARYELGALGTDVFDFYEGLGWERWPSVVVPLAGRQQEALLAASI